MRFSNVYRSLVGTVMNETEKAIQFRIDISDETDDLPRHKTEWFPRSQLSSVHILKGVDEDVIMASEWILGQKKWLDYAGAAGYNPAVSTVIQQQVVPIIKPATTSSVNALADKLKHPPVRSRVDMDDDIPF